MLLWTIWVKHWQGEMDLEKYCQKRSVGIWKYSDKWSAHETWNKPADAFDSMGFGSGRGVALVVRTTGNQNWFKLSLLPVQVDKNSFTLLTKFHLFRGTDVVQVTQTKGPKVRGSKIKTTQFCSCGQSNGKYIWRQLCEIDSPSETAF